MNAFLWVGVAGTLLLAVAVLVDGLDDSFDALDVGPGWLSLPVLAAFLAAFGFGAGALVGAVGGLAIVPGVLAGAAFGALAVRLTAAAQGMHTDPTDNEASLLGSLGRIVTPTAPGRYGEALLTRPAGPVKVSCTAPEPLAAGTEVVVVDVVSSTLVVVEAFDTALGAGHPPDA